MTDGSADDGTPDRAQASGRHLSAAARFFHQHPDLRAAAMASDAFRAFQQNYRPLEIDGQQMYVRRGVPMMSGGDTLMDGDELLIEWARHEVRAAQPTPPAQQINDAYETSKPSTKE